MKHVYVVFITLFYTALVHAQVGIGTTSPTSTLDLRGSFSPAYRSFSGSTTLTSSDHTSIFTGTVAATVTLPDATTCGGRLYVIKNYSTTTPAPVLTVATTSSQLIDGHSTWTLDVADEVFAVVSDGTNWEVENLSTPAPAGGGGTSWNQGGNSVAGTMSIGTITAYDMPFITSNTERMRITSAGNVGIGSTAFSASAEALLVYQNSATSFNVIGGKGNLNNYLQLNIQNKNNGANASSDLVATADNGNETTNYVDLGINSSGYSTTGVTGGVNNAYLYSQANDFVIGNGTNNHNLIFFTTNATAGAEHMRINSAGNVGINNTSPAAQLDVAGTVKIGTAGTVLNSIIRFTNQSITDNNSISYNQIATETITLAGVKQYASLIVTPRGMLATGLGIGYAYAPSANTVNIIITNSSAVDNALGTIAFDITVIQ